jgi:hypothetical protein
MKLDKALRREARQRKQRQGMRVSNRSLKVVQAALAARAQARSSPSPDGQQQEAQRG